MYVYRYIYICIYVLTLCFIQGLAHQMYDIKGSNIEQYAHLKKRQTETMRCTAPLSPN